MFTMAHNGKTTESSGCGKMITDAIQQECKNIQAKISSQINDVITNHIPSQVDSSVKNYMSGHILHVHPTQATPTSIQEQQQLYLIMRDNTQLQQDDLPIWLDLKYKFERLHMATTLCRPFVVRPRDQDDPHDDAHPEGEKSAKRHKTLSMEPLCLENRHLVKTLKVNQIPIEKVSQELVDEMSHTVDEAKLRKVVDEKPTIVIQSFQRDPKARALSLLNQDLLYLKKGSSGPEKIVMSLHKFLAVIFSDDDIEERNSRWTYWELGHEHKFITEIVARRANGSIVSITESEYKNLNKDDIKDMYLLIVNNKVDDYAKTSLLWSLSVFITSIENFKMFFIIFEPVYVIIYKNSKKEKRVMRRQEVYKFCNSTLERVLKGLKSYNNGVKHGYVTLSLGNEDVEYLQLFKEEIEERLKHRDQMRCWEIYVNGRPLGSRRERPE
ncbi:hypothetical protein Tco_0924500 [Tanacetum coccineum]|uniref:Uncharacterized protein n=1 Tax=Tanacetum coccineum TaxID=301880 RepID=A0ABQ5D778_9ASTR